MATITKRGNTWRCQIRRQGYKPVSASFDTKRDAQIWASEVEGKMARGKWIDPSDSHTTKLKDALERYLQEVTPLKKGKKQESNRIKALCRLPLADWYLTEITTKQIVELRDKLVSEGKAPSTIKNTFIILSQVYKTARSEWHMSDLNNPIEHIRMPKNRAGRERRLKHWEEQALYEQLKSPYLEAVKLALETALRRSELCRLLWEDVNLNKYVALIRDTKNGEDRVIPLSPTATAILESLPRTSTSVLDIPSPDTLTWFFRQACKEALIKDLTFHDLRHEAISRLVEGRLFELAEIMQISGHKTLSAFNTYMHSRAEKLAERMRGTK